MMVKPKPAFWSYNVFVRNYSHVLRTFFSLLYLHNPVLAVQVRLNLTTHGLMPSFLQWLWLQHDRLSPRHTMIVEIYLGLPIR
jgi:hypothetical protein